MDKPIVEILQVMTIGDIFAILLAIVVLIVIGMLGGLIVALLRRK